MGGGRAVLQRGHHHQVKDDLAELWVIVYLGAALHLWLLGSVNVVIHLLHDSPLVHEQEGEEQPAAASLFLELLASSTGIQLLQDSPFMHRHEECGWGVQLEAASLGLSFHTSTTTTLLISC